VWEGGVGGNVWEDGYVWEGKCGRVVWVWVWVWV